MTLLVTLLIQFPTILHQMPFALVTILLPIRLCLTMSLLHSMYLYCYFCQCVILVQQAKAYTTRVGAGPYPTEIFGDLGEKVREVGREYGTTTGRPRRVGWLDVVALRYVCK